MNPDEFRTSPSGRLVPTVRGALAFVPSDLPPRLDIASLANILANAALQLGELRGIGTTLSNPYLLTRPLQRREAVASSAIEGTIASLEQLMLFEAVEKTVDDTRSAAHEVSNYVRALEHGIRRLNDIPVSLRLIRELHEILLSDLPDYRGGRIRPGEFRGDQNWIGRGGADIADARFVPPPPNEMHAALDALEKYTHTPLGSDPHLLIRLALIHYQFEAIHPFPDGNGRVGRLLIPLIMVETGFMPQPLLYLSPYFERQQDAYYDHLLDVSRCGAWESWLRFFLRGVIEQCEDTISRVRDLQRLHAEYRSQLRPGSAYGSALRLIDFIFESPLLTVPNVRDRLGVTFPSAQRAVDRLVETGVLRIAATGRPRVYLAAEVFGIINRSFGGEPPATSPAA